MLKDNLLYATEIPITQNIYIKIPTMKEIIDYDNSANEDYYNLVTQICANPRDFAVQLHEAGLRYNKIRRYDLFNIFFKTFIVNGVDLSMIFKDFDISQLRDVVNKYDKVVWVNYKNEVIIDEIIYSVIEDNLRKLTGLVRCDGKAGNSIQYEREIADKKRKLEKKKRSHKIESSYLERQIVAMVNNKDFPYDYETIKNITLYQFNKSVEQVLRNTNVTCMTQSAYIGMIDTSKINQKELSLVKLD